MIKKFNNFITEGHNGEEITRKMMDDIIALNGELTLDDIKYQFLDLTDYNAISFSGFYINFSRRTTTDTTYPQIDGESDYSRPIIKEVDYITYTVNVSVDILRSDFRDKYLELRHDMTIPEFKELYGHEFIEFNSNFRKFPDGSYSKYNSDKLCFWPKKVLWL